MTRVPRQADPINFSDHLIHMQAYWKYQWVEFKAGLKGRFTLAGFAIILLDWLRFRLVSLII